MYTKIKSFYGDWRRFPSGILFYSLVDVFFFLWSLRTKAHPLQYCTTLLLTVVLLFTFFCCTKRSYGSSCYILARSRLRVLHYYSYCCIDHTAYTERGECCTLTTTAVLLTSEWRVRLLYEYEVLPTADSSSSSYRQLHCSGWPHVLVCIYNMCTEKIKSTNTVRGKP